MKPAVCKSDLPEERVCKPAANERRMPPKTSSDTKKQSEIK